MPEMANLSLVELLDRADRGYADSFLSQYYDSATGERVEGSGDTLAEFIVNELSETFDAEASFEAQIDEAHRTLRNGIEALESVSRALDEAA